MKYLLSIYLLLPCLLIAQVPQGFTYQAVATDNNGLELVEQNISVRVSILSESSTGVEQWIETHSTTTDGFGLFTITIGEGTSTGNGVQSSFSDIDWGGSEHYLKIEMDVNGSSDYQLLGTSQLMSVPYALHAGTSDQGNNQSEQIDSMLSQFETFSTNLSSITTGNSINETNGITSICDLSYSGDTIYKLGEALNTNSRIVKGYKVDNQGNLYLLYNLQYCSDNELYGINTICANPNQDYSLLVKYNSDGDILWDVKFNFRASRIADFNLFEDKLIFILRENILIEGEAYIADIDLSLNSGGAFFVHISTDGDLIEFTSPTNIQEIYSADFGDDFFVISSSTGLKTYSYNYDLIESIDLNTDDYSHEDNDILVVDDNIYYMRRNTSRYLSSFQSDLSTNWTRSFPVGQSNYAMQVGEIYHNNLQSFGDNIIFTDIDDSGYNIFSLNIINKITGDTEYILSSSNGSSQNDGKIDISYTSNDELLKVLIGVTPGGLTQSIGLNVVYFSDFILSYNRLFEITYNQDFQISDLREYPKDSRLIEHDFDALVRLINEVGPNNYNYKYVYHNYQNFCFNEEKYTPGIYIIKQSF